MGKIPDQGLIGCGSVFVSKREHILHFFQIRIFQEGISIANLADRLGLSRQGISTRFVRDNCSMKDMEEMAAAAGYKFVWSWEKVEKDED